MVRTWCDSPVVATLFSPPLHVSKLGTGFLLVHNYNFAQHSRRPLPVRPTVSDRRSKSWLLRKPPAWKLSAYCSIFPAQSRASRYCSFLAWNLIYCMALYRSLTYLPQVVIALQRAPSPRFVFPMCADPQHLLYETSSKSRVLVVPLVSLGRVFPGNSGIRLRFSMVDAVLHCTVQYPVLDNLVRTAYIYRTSRSENTLGIETTPLWYLVRDCAVFGVDTGDDQIARLFVYTTCLFTNNLQ